MLVADTLDRVPLLPDGNVWVLMRDGRDVGGSMSLLPEVLIGMMLDRSWKLADKVYRRSLPEHTKFKSVKTNRRYFGCIGYWLRFTRLPPELAWCDEEKFSMSEPIWDRTDVEDSSWYTMPILLTCPEGGTVVDPFKTTKFVEEAASKLGRKFVLI